MSEFRGMPLRAEARVFGATRERGQTVEYEIGGRRYLCLAPSVGQVPVNGVQIDTRDGAAITDVRRLTITAVRDSEFVLLDAPEARPVPPQNLPREMRCEEIVQ